MAQLNPTQIETHNQNTGNVNAIINSNWTHINQQQSHAADVYGASLAVDLSTEQLRSVALTGNISLTTTERYAGRRCSMRVQADGSTRTLAFHASWVWVGTMPTNLAASKTGLLELWCFGSAESDIMARWTAQP